MKLFSVFSKNQSGFEQTTNPTGTVGSSLGKMEIRAFAAAISGAAGYHSRSQRLLSDFSTVSQADPGSEVGRLCRRHVGIISWPPTQYQQEHAFLLVPGKSAWDRRERIQRKNLLPNKEAIQEKLCLSYTHNLPRWSLASCCTWTETTSDRQR